jgi:hypothetical protein
MAGCSPRPDAVTAERSITEYFEQRGYRVKDISIGKMSRNPIAEREYMAPLTYAVEVPSIVLELKSDAAGRPADYEPEGMTFSAVTIKMQALSPPRRGWAVLQVVGIELP